MENVCSIQHTRYNKIQDTIRYNILTHSLYYHYHYQTDLQTPQAFLDKALEQRGYATKKYSSLEGGYYCRPTPLQQASYGSRVSLAIRASDTSLLRRLLDSGLSPNPCNNYGESLVHMVCRRGDHRLLRIMLEAGCSLQVTDDYGRTPLHDACWRADPSFETVKLILDSDQHLLHLLDCRGAAPLSYIKKENYGKWMDFLEANVDTFWPRRDIGQEGEERPPPLTLRQPHSLPIPDPGHALPLEVAAMVSNGRMEPEEAIFLDDDSSDDDDDSDSDDSSYDSEEDDDSYDSDESGGSSGDDSDFDADEMAEICLRAGGPMAIARKCFKNDAASAMAAMGGPRKMA
jgi:ankyrin repeat protein